MLNPVLKKQIREFKKRGLEVYNVPVYHKNYFLQSPKLWLMLPNFSMVGDSVIPGVTAILACTNVGKLDHKLQIEIKEFFGVVINYGMSGVISSNEIVKLLSGKETTPPIGITIDSNIYKQIKSINFTISKLKNNIVETAKSLDGGTHKIRIANLTNTELMEEDYSDYVKLYSLNVCDEDKDKFNLLLNILRSPALHIVIGDRKIPFVFNFENSVKVITKVLGSGRAYQYDCRLILSPAASLIRKIIGGYYGNQS